MVHLLLSWLLYAVSLFAVAQVINGIRIAGFGRAMVAAAILAVLNATLGAVLKLITLPFAILSLGIVWLVVNALLLMLTAGMVKGFEVKGFVPAFVGAILLSLINWVLRVVVF